MEANGVGDNDSPTCWANLKISGANMVYSQHLWANIVSHSQDSWASLIASFQSILARLAVREKFIDFLGLLSLFVILILLVYVWLNDMCIVEHSKLSCKISVYIMIAFTFLVLLIYICTMLIRDGIWESNCFNWIPRWLSFVLNIGVATALIFLSNSFSYLEILSKMCLVVVELLVIAFWCWEYNLGQRHYLALSSCSVSVGVSLSITIVTDKLSLLTGSLEALVALVTLLFVYFTLPAPTLHITLPLHDPNAPIGPHTLLLRPHTNLGYGTFKLKDCHSNITSDDLYEFAVIPNEGALMRRYEIVAAGPGN